MYLNRIDEIFILIIAGNTEMTDYFLFASIVEG